MKKEIFTTLMVVLISFMGFIFSLMQMYSSPDGNSYPLNGSLIYLGTSIFIFIFLLTLKKDILKAMKFINILLVFIFAIFAILLALICLYAAPIEGEVYPLASAVFVVSGMISFSSIFLINKFVVETFNKTLEEK